MWGGGVVVGKCILHCRYKLVAETVGNRAVRGCYAVEFLPRTFSLPGGVYNFGAQNRLNTYETACCYFEMLSCGLCCDDFVIADADRYPTHERNISISNEKIFSASNGAVFFNDTLDGLRIFVECHR